MSRRASRTESDEGSTHPLYTYVCMLIVYTYKEEEEDIETKHASNNIANETFITP